MLRVADVSGSVRSGRTRHVVDGAPVDPIERLAIAQYADDQGFYLLYCDVTWQTLTDTFHETIDAAVAQAAFEFEPVIWTDPAPHAS